MWNRTAKEFFFQVITFLLLARQVSDIVHSMRGKRFNSSTTQISNGKKQVKRPRKGSGDGLAILRKPANNTDHETGTEMGCSYLYARAVPCVQKKREK